MSRRSKQALIFTIFAFFLFGVIAFIYFVFIYSAPSCYDGKQNQDERGIDCEGVCGGFCYPTNARAPMVLGKIDVLPAGATGLTFLARVQNPNTDVAAESVSYEFVLTGEGGRVLQTARGTTYFYAGETKYIIAPRLAGSVDDVRESSLSFSNPTWVSGATYTRPVVTIRNHETVVLENSIETTGVVQNQDQLSSPRFSVLAIYFGRFGQIAGATQTQMENLGVGEARAFTLVHPSIQGIDVGATQVFVFARRP